MCYLPAMRIVTWNVNGVRAAVKKGLVDIIRDMDADVFCIQETKAQDDQVREALAAVLDDHELAVNSAEKKGYSGTAILSRRPFESVDLDIGIDEHDHEGRVTTVDLGSFQLTNVYVPNAGSGLKRLDYRAEWDRAFGDYLAERNGHKPLIATGDFNVAHRAIDLKNPKNNYDKTAGFTQVEIDGLDAILDKGFVDIWRARNPEAVKYTFWSMRFKARERNAGWRIDYFLVPPALAVRVTDVEIRNDVFGSDHCPVVLEVEG